MFFDEDDLEDMVEEFDSSDDSASEDEVHGNANAQSKVEIIQEVTSLQDICLQTISDNLERFNVAVTFIKDINFQMHLYYLRRVHTSFFLSNKLKEDDGFLKKKYWDFLLNEHLKEFRLSMIELKDWDDLPKKLDEVGHGIEKVHFDLCIAVEFEKAEFEKAVVFVKKVLLKLQNIKILQLHSYCDDTVLEMLPSCCTELEELSMINSRISDKGLKFLCQKKNSGEETHSLSLRVIDLSGITQINDGVSYLLKNMPSLELIVYQELYVVLCSMYKHDMHKASEDKYNLTSFSIPYDFVPNPNIHNALLILSKCCPCIKVLSVPIKVKTELQYISNLPELEDFSAIDVSPTSNLDFNWFLEQKGGTLKRLKIGNFKISVATLVESCPILESLTLQYTYFHLSDPNINLKQLHNLRELSIKSIHFNDNFQASIQAVIEILNCSPKLKNLTFIDCEFRHNDVFTTKFAKFCENSDLHNLEFTACDLDMSLLQTILLTCSSLKTLVLDQCYEIDSSDVEALYKISISLKNKVEINWKDDRSEFNSIDSYGDLFEYGSDSDLVYFDSCESDYYYNDGYDDDYLSSS